MTLERRVQLCPFEVHEARRGNMIGWDRLRRWIVLDELGTDLLLWLDDGASMADARERAHNRYGRHVNIQSFVSDLQSIGLVEAHDRERGNQRAVPRPARQAHERLWWLGTAIAGLGTLYSAVLFAYGVVRLPSGMDAIVPDVPVGLQLLVFLTAAVVTDGLHEAAHVLVGRDCGLEAAVGLGRRAWWLVMHTRMPGIWSLPGGLRWRPIAAGLVADAIVVSGACTALALLDADSVAWFASRVVLTVTLARVIWQCQWYLRTDLYYLILMWSECIDLRHVTFTWLRAGLARGLPRLRDNDDGPTPGEYTTVIAYLASLPLAFGATALLLWWMLLPLARLLVPTTIGVWPIR